jgi:hypothetical protein
MSRKRAFLNYLGWFGGCLALLAYGANTQQLISSSSPAFLLMNTTACICLIYYTFQKQAFANTAINAVHLLITLIAIGGALLN